LGLLFPIYGKYITNHIHIYISYIIYHISYIHTLPKTNILQKIYWVGTSNLRSLTWPLIFISVVCACSVCR
jgi:hypothetical protein